MSQDLPYSTTFASSIRVINESDGDTIMEAKASINELGSLSGLLPSDLRPEEESDIIVVAANLLVAGTVNKNDDGMSVEDCLATYKKYEKRFCDFAHNRANVIGYIVKAGLTEYGTNRIISEDEARALDGKFNIATVTILWKAINKELCEFIVENCSNPESDAKDDLSLSFEVGFSDYSIGILPKGSSLLSDASIILTREDKQFSIYDAILKKNGGTGTRGGNRVIRILGGVITPLGQGIVLKPASDVKGLLPIVDSPKIQEITKEVEQATFDGNQDKPIDSLLQGVGDKDNQSNKPTGHLDMNHAPIVQPDLEIYPVTASDNNFKDNNSNNQTSDKNMKVKLDESVQLAVAAQLDSNTKYEVDESGTKYCLASVQLENDITLKDVKVYGNDHICLTYDGDVSELKVKTVKVYLPFIDKQLVAKRTIDLFNDDLRKVIDDIIANLTSAKQSLSSMNKSDTHPLSDILDAK